MNARLRAGLAAAVSTMAVGAVAAPAHASLLNLDPGSCGTAATSQPFARWLDSGNYTLVPGGNFESGAPAWSLAGGAALQNGNESYQVGGAGDASSLSLPAGSSATSPAMCTSIYRPTLRFFARNTGSALSSMRVEVLYPGLLGKVNVLQLGVLSGPSWSPSLPMPIVASLLSTLPGNSTSLAFRFSPIGAAGSWSIDDVFVDPYSRR